MGEDTNNVRDYAYELLATLKSMLYIFGRGLEPASIGDMTCDKARKLVAEIKAKTNP